MQGTESEGDGSILEYMTEPESRKQRSSSLYDTTSRYWIENNCFAHYVVLAYICAVLERITLRSIISDTYEVRIYEGRCCCSFCESGRLRL